MGEESIKYKAWSWFGYDPSTSFYYVSCVFAFVIFFASVTLLRQLFLDSLRTKKSFIFIFLYLENYNMLFLVFSHKEIHIKLLYILISLPSASLILIRWTLAQPIVALGEFNLLGYSSRNEEGILFLFFWEVI